MILHRITTGLMVLLLTASSVGFAPLLLIRLQLINSAHRTAPRVSAKHLKCVSTRLCSSRSLIFCFMLNMNFYMWTFSTIILVFYFLNNFGYYVDYLWKRGGIESRHRRQEIKTLPFIVSQWGPGYSWHSMHATKMYNIWLINNFVKLRIFSILIK